MEKLTVPRLIELGVDVLNMQQTRNYGLVEFGEQFRGKVCLCRYRRHPIDDAHASCSTSL